MASWAEDQERGRRFDELLREEPGFMPDPKPVGRVKADLKDWKITHQLLVNEHSRCQICGASPWGERNGQLLGVSIHHLVPRSQGGDDVLANLAVLCGHGTVGCHGDVEARRNGARARLRAAMTFEQLQYVMEKKGHAWADRHYAPDGMA